ncbi:MAG: hypothetical protein R2838_05730 [Caldilineaceae bacterium]
MLALSLAAIAVFIINGQVNWWFGLLMAVQTSALLAARFAVNYPNSNVWVRRSAHIIIVSALKLFGAFDLVLGMFG